MSHTRRTYTGEFNRFALELALVGKKTMAELERDLGLSKGLLKQWVRKARARRGGLWGPGSTQAAS